MASTTGHLGGYHGPAPAPERLDGRQELVGLQRLERDRLVDAGGPDRHPPQVPQVGTAAERGHRFALAGPYPPGTRGWSPFR